MCKAFKMNGCAVVEFHAFRSNTNKFIVKELVIVNERCEYIYILFKSPYEKTCLNKHYYKIAKWLENKYHCISWDSGECDYSESLISSLLADYSVIYTKGCEKSVFLKRFHNNVLTLNTKIPKPGLEHYLECPAHTHGHCALQSAVFYMNYLLDQTNYAKEANRLASFHLSTEPIENIEKLSKHGFYYNVSRRNVTCFWCDDCLNMHIPVCVRAYKKPFKLEMYVHRLQ